MVQKVVEDLTWTQEWRNHGRINGNKRIKLMQAHADLEHQENGRAFHIQVKAGLINLQ